jgi:hypothetical protein
VTAGAPCPAAITSTHGEVRCQRRADHPVAIECHEWRQSHMRGHTGDQARQISSERIVRWDDHGWRFESLEMWAP